MKKSLLILITLCAALQIKAQDTVYLTLDQALQTALSENATVRIRQA